LLRRAPEEKADAFMDAPTEIDALIKSQILSWLKHGRIVAVGQNAAIEKLIGPNTWRRISIALKFPSHQGNVSASDFRN
jgi:hypothetical protein